MLFRLNLASYFIWYTNFLSVPKKGRGLKGEKCGDNVAAAAQLLPTVNRFVGTERSWGETFVW